MKKTILYALLLSLVSCLEAQAPKNKQQVTQQQPTKHHSSSKPQPTTVSTTTNNQYAWASTYDIKTALVNRIAVPTGYQRIAVAKGTFGDWLRHVPLKAEGSKVHYFNGAAKHNQTIHKAVLNLDVGKRDLQQCADAVMRLKAEYHYSLGDYKNIHFNYTSGHKVSFDDWRQGRQPRIQGNRVVFTRKTGTVNNSYANFKKYMQQIFSYAGTASLSKELKSVPLSDIQIGDIFIQGGFPGHAVLVVDVAQNEVGEKIFMIAQSYMPAQDMHILKNLNDDGTLLDTWYPANFGTTLYTPEWTFSKTDLKRFMK